MTQHLFRYHTYVLRFWQEQDGSENGRKWRFTLIDSTKDHRYGFSSLEDLMSFLQAQISEK